MYDIYSELSVNIDQNPKGKISINFVEVELLKILADKNQDSEGNIKGPRAKIIRKIYKYDSEKEIKLNSKEVKKILLKYTKEDIHPLLINKYIPTESGLQNVKNLIGTIKTQESKFFNKELYLNNILRLNKIYKYFEDLSLSSIIKEKYVPLEDDLSQLLKELTKDEFIKMFKGSNIIRDWNFQRKLDYFYTVKDFLKTIDIDIPES